MTAGLGFLNLDRISNGVSKSESPPENVTDAFDAMYASAVISAYSVFEILAADLWVTMLNLRPASLGVAALNAKPRDPSDSDPDLDSEGKRFVSIVKQFLIDHGFNLAGAMGSGLRDKYRWVSFVGITAAYMDVFPEADKRLKKVFYDPGMRSLSAVRNVLVHKGGLVDAEFVQKAAHDPTLRSYRQPQKLFIDGPLLSTLAGAAVSNAATLIEFADEWISTHPA